MTIDEGQLENLRERAQNLLAPLNKSSPLFVEFAGTPKSGKSTCIEIVNHFFRRLDYKVLAPAEGASKRTPYYLRENLVAFNAWSATYALTHILEGRYGADKYHLVIMDRGLFDALAWFELLLGRQEIKDDECSTIQNFLLIEHWRKFVDMVFLFESDPATSLERENRDKLIEEHGQAMNPDFLGDLNEAYHSIMEKYSGQFSQLDIVNTGNAQGTSPQLTAFEVVEKIITQMEKGVSSSQ